MLNKYFLYDDFKITLNRPELLLIKEFQALMDIEYNKCKEDKSGEKRIKAFKVFTYLFLLNDHSSPYSEKDLSTRQYYALEDSKLDQKDLLDDIFIKASFKYEVLTKSRLSKMLDGAQIAVDKFTLYFNTVDYTDIDEVTGKPRFNIKDGISSVSILGKLVDGLKTLQEQVKREAEADSTLRGGTEAGLLD